MRVADSGRRRGRTGGLFVVAVDYARAATRRLLGRRVIVLPLDHNSPAKFQLIQTDE